MSRGFDSCDVAVMTVKELIEELRKCPSDAVVYRCDGENDPTPVAIVEERADGVWWHGCLDHGCKAVLLE
jgi:hypothetical protein